VGLAPKRRRLSSRDSEQMRNNPWPEGNRLSSCRRDSRSDFRMEDLKLAFKSYLRSYYYYYFIILLLLLLEVITSQIRTYINILITQEQGQLSILIGLFFNYFICSRLKFINSVELYL
jgi:hypothetical protein